MGFFCSQSSSQNPYLQVGSERKLSSQRHRYPWEVVGDPLLSSSLESPSVTAARQTLAEALPLPSLLARYISKTSCVSRLSVVTLGLGGGWAAQEVPVVKVADQAVMYSVAAEDRDTRQGLADRAISRHETHALEAGHEEMTSGRARCTF